MLLKHKTAVVYGAGSIGSAVARAFAREGAQVFLASRTLPKLQAVAQENIEIAQVDALDEQSVTNFINTVAQKSKIDITFNAIGIEDIQGTPLIDMPFEVFSHPITVATRTQWLTAKAVAPHMIQNGSGVIMMITATPARLGIPFVGGFSVACAAVEAFSRSLAAELGPKGIRVLCLRSAGSPESIKEIMDLHATANGLTSDEFVALLKDMTLLKKLPSLSDVGNVAALMASDYANTMTGTVANMTCGQIVD